jgi:hypothetical protein
VLAEPSPQLLVVHQERLSTTWLRRVWRLLVSELGSLRLWYRAVSQAIVASNLLTHVLAISPNQPTNLFFRDCDGWICVKFSRSSASLVNLPLLDELAGFGESIKYLLRQMKLFGSREFSDLLD